MSCILRVGGTVFNVTEFLRGSSLTGDRVWNKGDLRRDGTPHDGSGFTVIVSEAEMTELAWQIEDAVEFLREHQADLQRLRSCPEVEYKTIDFGIAARNVVAQFDQFPPELLQLAGNLGIGLEISRYQTSLDERGQRGDRSKFERAIAKVKDVPPQPEDAL